MVDARPVIKTKPNKYVKRRKWDVCVEFGKKNRKFVMNTDGFLFVVSSYIELLGEIVIVIGGHLIGD